MKMKGGKERGAGALLKNTSFSSTSKKSLATFELVTRRRPLCFQMLFVVILGQRKTGYTEETKDIKMAVMPNKTFCF